MNWQKTLQWGRNYALKRYIPISSQSSPVKSRALFEPVSLQAKPLFHVDITLNEAAKHWESYLNFLERKKEGEEADLIQQWQIKLAKNAEPPKPANTHTRNSKGAAGDETIKLETVKKDGAIMSDPEPCGQPSACVNPITHLIPALRHILHFKIPINLGRDGIPKSSLNWALGKKKKKKLLIITKRKQESEAV